MSTSKAESIGAMKDHATQLFQSIIEQATARAMAETRTTGNRATRKVRSTLNNSSPSVRDIALNAASGAIELWQAAKDRAESTVESVQTGVTGTASDLLHGVSDIKQGASDRARQGANDIKDGATQRVHLVTSTVGDSAHRVADTGKSVAVSSARTGRNAVGLAIWTGAAGAIAYYAFLNEERREKARTIAMRVISEGRTLLNDLQGHDGTFAPKP